jgi:4-hydroxybenzoate polyprenyltransferase
MVLSAARIQMWQGRCMKHLSPLRRAIGIVLVMVGVTWFALGAGFIEGSVMSGQFFWAVMGVALAIGGGYVLYRGLPKR